MPVSFTVLASGSTGNASVLEADAARVLIDCGIGPRQLAERMRTVGLSWPDISAVVLTHTHGDHWRDTTFKHICKYRIPFFCHGHHARSLQRESPNFQTLLNNGLVRTYSNASCIDFGSGLVCWPIPVSHDGGPTFGFRFVSRRPDGTAPLMAAFLTDLGNWTPELVQLVANVDLLALEFNHDVEMELTSGRSIYLVERVLGKYGHLSNEQAALFLKEILLASQPGRLQHLVQLHLSRDCNHPELAFASAKCILDEMASAANLITADGDVPTCRLHLASRLAETTTVTSSSEDIQPTVLVEEIAVAVRARKTRYSALQPFLPGFQVE
jgi:phosphoribosyl 1,2-cyclic phosphodiesterase